MKLESRWKKQCKNPNMFLYPRIPCKNGKGAKLSFSHQKYTLADSLLCYNRLLPFFWSWKSENCTANRNEKWWCICSKHDPSNPFTEWFHHKKMLLFTFFIDFRRIRWCFTSLKIIQITVDIMSIWNLLHAYSCWRHLVNDLWFLWSIPISLLTTSIQNPCVLKQLYWEECLM